MWERIFTIMTQTTTYRTATTISPKEFVRLWNLLHKKMVSCAASIEVLPTCILEMEYTTLLHNQLQFVVSRVNVDAEFFGDLPALLRKLELVVTTESNTIYVMAKNEQETNV